MKNKLKYIIGAGLILSGCASQSANQQDQRSFSGIEQTIETCSTDPKMSLILGKELCRTYDGSNYKVKLEGVNEDGAVIAVNGYTKQMKQGDQKNVGGVDLELTFVKQFGEKAFVSLKRVKEK